MAKTRIYKVLYKLKIFLTPKSAHIEILKKIKELAILYLNPI